MAGTLQVAKLWHAGFSYVQTSSKPCSNLKFMGPDHASRCDSILKKVFVVCTEQLRYLIRFLSLHGFDCDAVDAAASDS